MLSIVRKLLSEYLGIRWTHHFIGVTPLVRETPALRHFRYIDLAFDNHSKPFLKKDLETSQNIYFYRILVVTSKENVRNLSQPLCVLLQRKDPMVDRRIETLMA